MGKLIDLTGRRFGRLLVVNRANKNSFGEALWECQCDCGNSHIAKGSSLRRGKCLSCGCYQRECISKAHTKHNMYGTRLYHIWSGMIQRCTNPNNSKYKNYGKRGIKVCDEWKDFSNFYKWASATNYAENLTIDRVDVNGNYTPDNCRWTTINIQENNRTNNFVISICGTSHTLAEWCRIYHISYSTVQERIRHNWDITTAITTPIRKRRE